MDIDILKFNCKPGKMTVYFYEIQVLNVALKELYDLVKKDKVGFFCSGQDDEQKMKPVVIKIILQLRDRLFDFSDKRTEEMGIPVIRDEMNKEWNKEKIK